MSFIVVYVTHSDADSASAIVESLLHEKLIACANTFPITSNYWWESATQNEKEIVTLLKTKKDNWKRLKKKIIELHPYDVPCIIKWTVKANNEYEQWIEKCLD